MSTVEHFAGGIDSWIIQDGNYGDFSAGDNAKFALEFSGRKLQPSESRQAQVRPAGKAVYQVCAQVVFNHPDVWVIDFGLLAFWESAPPEFATPGSWGEGEIFLGIDPFFYMEYLNKISGMPNLFYEWQIASILRNDTPWLMEVNERGGKTFSRESGRETWSEVGATDAWNDDDGRSSYVLTVARRDV